jgi:hypothetical protein
VLQKLRFASVAKCFGCLLLVSIASILANGYHYATDDGGLYIPAILQRLHPSLYSFDGQFIRAQAGYSVYALIASAVARCLGGSVPASVFVLHGLGVFVLLAAGWLLANAIFQSGRAAWCAVCVLAFTTSIFVAGTSIPLMDPYFTARTLSTPLTLLAVSSMAARKWLFAFCAFGLACAIHPLMAAFAVFFGGCYWAAGKSRRTLLWSIVIGGLLLFSMTLRLKPLSDAVRETLEMSNRHFFFASRWSAFDWAGVVSPLAFYFVLWRTNIASTRPLLRRISKAALLCGTAATALFLIVSFTPGLESCVRLQPMRAFQLLYTVMFLIVGGFAGEFILRGHAWRLALLFIALITMAFAIDYSAYPASRHIEWPNAVSANEWVAAFEWARVHTPGDAVFALSPKYIEAAGEDRHGFRAIAQRSALADEVKDSGVVSMLPAFAPEWKRQVDAQSGWESFTMNDFQQLARQYPVRWIVVDQKRSSDFNCPYQNATVAVCRIAP